MKLSEQKAEYRRLRGALRRYVDLVRAVPSTEDIGWLLAETELDADRAMRLWKRHRRWADRRGIQYRPEVLKLAGQFVHQRARVIVRYQRAHGITASPEQAESAKRRLAEMIAMIRGGRREQ